MYSIWHRCTLYVHTVECWRQHRLHIRVEWFLREKFGCPPSCAKLFKDPFLKFVLTALQKILTVSLKWAKKCFKPVPGRNVFLIFFYHLKILNLKLKKYSFLSSMVFFIYYKNLAARASKFANFLRIGLIKIYLIGTIGPSFEICKKCNFTPP